MRELVGVLALVALILAVPVVPFLGFGPALEARIETQIASPHGAATAAALVAGLLATDVLLPIPSSLLSTVGGARLGFVGGTLASWVGMTAGAVLGYVLARVCGPPLARRLAGPGEYERIAGLVDRLGPRALVVTRALPVLAEASVLLVGATRLEWRRFWPPVVLSNLGIAAAYSWFGQYARAHDATLLALLASILLPVTATLLARRLLPSGAPAIR